MCCDEEIDEYHRSPEYQDIVKRIITTPGGLGVEDAPRFFEWLYAYPERQAWFDHDVIEMRKRLAELPKPVIYIIGSLRNPLVPELANEIESWGFEAFASWFAAGEIADDRWRDYEKKRGQTFKQALSGYAAKHVFEFDKYHLERADAVVLQSPAGKSGFLELGWSLGKNKPGYILLDNPDRWDVMFQFATYVADTVEDLRSKLRIDFKERLSYVKQS